MNGPFSPLVSFHPLFCFPFHVCLLIAVKGNAAASRDAAAAAAFAAVAAFRAAVVAHDKRRRSDLARRGYYVPPPPPPPPPLPPTAAGTGNTVATYLPLPVVPAVLSASPSSASPTGQPLTSAHIDDIAYAARRCIDTATLGRLFRAAPPSIGLVNALVAVGKALVRDVTVLLPPPPVLPLPVAPSDPVAGADASPPLPATLSAAGSTGSASAYGDGPSAGAGAGAGPSPSVCPVVWDDNAATSAAGLPQVPRPFSPQYSFFICYSRQRPHHHAIHVALVA